MFTVRRIATFCTPLNRVRMRAKLICGTFARSPARACKTCYIYFRNYTLCINKSSRAHFSYLWPSICAKLCMLHIRCEWNTAHFVAAAATFYNVHMRGCAQRQVSLWCSIHIREEKKIVFKLCALVFFILISAKILEETNVQQEQTQKMNTNRTICSSKSNGYIQI